MPLLAGQFDGENVQVEEGGVMLDVVVGGADIVVGGSPVDPATPLVPLKALELKGRPDEVEAVGEMPEVAMERLDTPLPEGIVVTFGKGSPLEVIGKELAEPAETPLGRLVTRGGPVKLVKEKPLDIPDGGSGAEGTETMPDVAGGINSLPVPSCPFRVSVGGKNVPLRLLKEMPLLGGRGGSVSDETGRTPVPEPEIKVELMIDVGGRTVPVPAGNDEEIGAVPEVLELRLTIGTDEVARETVPDIMVELITTGVELGGDADPERPLLRLTLDKDDAAVEIVPKTPVELSTDMDEGKLGIVPGILVLGLELAKGEAGLEGPEGPPELETDGDKAVDGIMSERALTEFGADGMGLGTIPWMLLESKGGVGDTGGGAVPERLLKEIPGLDDTGRGPVPEVLLGPATGTDEGSVVALLALITGAEEGNGGDAGPETLLELTPGIEEDD